MKAHGNFIKMMIDECHGAVVDFQATYDEYNRMKSYRFMGSGPYEQIEYDSLGRVWERIDMSSNEKMYHHTSRALAQEIEEDGEDLNVVTDYMARSRRFMPDEADAEKYRYYHRDHLGSVALMSGHAVATEEYTYDAWGEHVDTPPSTENKVRYAGAHLETFVGGSTSNAIYLCGERHYWASYGRFMQRDAMTYRQMPKPDVPLTVNPYIYAMNNPVMRKDLSGLASTWVRGCHRGSNTLRLGGNYPSDPSQIDCNNIPEITPALL